LGLLLDTNIIIWFNGRDKRLPARVSDRLMSGEDDLYVSAISGWEYGQKRKLRPAEMPKSFEDLLSVLPIVCLDFSFDLHRYAESLPLIHRDPFDRMLIAQALHNDLELVTPDTDIHRYPVRWFW
jgi:PIN domain nuclease of toxin-antitoxin system